MIRVVGLLAVILATALLGHAGGLDAHSLDECARALADWTTPTPNDVLRIVAGALGIVAMIAGWGLVLGSK